MATPRSGHQGEQGQVLAIFGLALTAMIAMIGLVLDGGSAFVQRRDQQNVADAAAMAGAYAWLNTGTAADGEAAARAAAAANGYVDGAEGVSVEVGTGVAPTGASEMRVTVTRPHRNYFAGIVGMPTWTITASAASIAGSPNAAMGPMPIVFNRDVFPGAYRETSFSEPAPGNNDIPLGPNQFNWTVYCVAQGSTGNGCNADTSVVEDLIRFENERDNEIVIGRDKISPLNAGSHTKLFSFMSEHVGSEFAVGIVDNSGKMVGWAMFHLTGSSGGSTKQLSGYFAAPVNAKGLYIAAGGYAGSSAFGAFTVKLVD